MSFPQTRLTLIQRLATGGSEEDWYRFLQDYRGPVCRFALRWGARDLDEAEDLASRTFEILLQNRLLTRWVANRSAKLRSLLCSVVRNLLSNRNRIRAGRERLEPDLLAHFERLQQARDEQVDGFYAAWVEDAVQQSVEALAAEYYAASKGDYVRVLYGRLCKRQSLAEIAQALEITAAMVDHYFRHARQRLGAKLEEFVRKQIERYCPPEEAADEFAREWQELGQYLAAHGGLEEAVQRAYDLLDPVQVKRHRGPSLNKAMDRLTSILRQPGDASPRQ